MLRYRLAGKLNVKDLWTIQSAKISSCGETECERLMDHSER